jgi:hypothetical protein
MENIYLSERMILNFPHKRHNSIEFKFHLIFINLLEVSGHLGKQSQREINIKTFH